MARKPRHTTRVSDLQMLGASSHILREWKLLGESAAELGGDFGERTARQQAAFDSTFVHIRCLINFLCGGYTGSRHDNDITPSDFLGRDWWPDDDQQFDRQMRGRLSVMNTEVLHLSWDRVDRTEPIWWSLILMARLTHHAMCLFVEELECEAGASPGVAACLPVFYEAQRATEGALPSVPRRTGETAVTLAPERR